MLECSVHSIDLVRARTRCFGELAPSRGHCRNFFDCLTRLRKGECEIFGRRLQQIEGASSFVEIDVGG
jgi:hypothetical protein